METINIFGLFEVEKKSAVNAVLGLIGAGLTILSIYTSIAYMPDLLPNLNAWFSVPLALIITSSFWGLAFAAFHEQESNWRRVVLIVAMLFTMMVDTGLTIGQMFAGSALIVVSPLVSRIIAILIMAFTPTNMLVLVVTKFLSSEVLDSILRTRKKGRLRKLVEQEIQTSFEEAAKAAAPNIGKQIASAYLAEVKQSLVLENKKSEQQHNQKQQQHNQHQRQMNPPQPDKSKPKNRPESINFPEPPRQAGGKK